MIAINNNNVMLDNNVLAANQTILYDLFDELEFEMNDDVDLIRTYLDIIINKITEEGLTVMKKIGINANEEVLSYDHTVGNQMGLYVLCENGWQVSYDGIELDVRQF